MMTNFKFSALFALIFVAANCYYVAVQCCNFVGGGESGNFDFLANLTEGQTTQFFEILFNPNSTKAEKKQSLTSFAQANGFGDKYSAFTQQVQTQETQMDTAATNNLQGAALDLYNKLAAIRKNDVLTHAAECQQVQTTLNGTDPSVSCFVPKNCISHCLFGGPFGNNRYNDVEVDDDTGGQQGGQN